MLVIKNVAGERGRGQKQRQEEIIGWKLEVRGDALEKSRVVGRGEIRHLGENRVKDQHLEGERMIMERIQRKTEARPEARIENIIKRSRPIRNC